MSSQNSRCYWNTKDWNLLVFWSLPPVVHKPPYRLGQPQLQVFHIHQVFCLHHCGGSLWPACLPLPSYWTGTPTTATTGNWSIECYRMFYSFWDPPSVTGIFCSWLQSTSTHPATTTVPKCSSSRGKRDIQGGETESQRNVTAYSWGK